MRYQRRFSIPHMLFRFYLTISIISFCFLSFWHLLFWGKFPSLWFSVCCAIPVGTYLLIFRVIAVWLARYELRDNLDYWMKIEQGWSPFWETFTWPVTPTLYEEIEQDRQEHNKKISRLMAQRYSQQTEDIWDDIASKMPDNQNQFVPPSHWRYVCPVCHSRVEKAIDVCWNCNYGANNEPHPNKR